MNASSVTGSKGIDTKDKSERKELTLVYKCVVIITNGNNPITSLEKAPTDGTAVISISTQLLSLGTVPDIQDPSVDSLDNAKIERDIITYPEADSQDKSDSTTQYLITKLEGYRQNYSNIILKIYLLGYNDGSVAQNCFIVALDNHLGESGVLKQLLDRERSTVETMSLNDEVERKYDRTKELPPIDAKLAAMFSHYVYYYMDWLEHSANFSGKMHKLLSFGKEDPEMEGFIENLDQLCKDHSESTDQQPPKESNPILEAIDATVNMAINAQGESIGNLVTGPVSTTGDIVESIGEAISTGTSTVGDSMETSGIISGNIAKTTGSVLGNIAETTGGVLGNSLRGAGESLGPVESAIGNVVGGAVSMTGSVVANGIEGAGSMVGDMATTSGTMAAKVVKTAGSAVGMVIAKSGALIRESAVATKNIIKSAWTATGKIAWDQTKRGIADAYYGLVFIKSILTKDSIVALGDYKVRQRIVNRLYEVVEIVGTEEAKAANTKNKKGETDVRMTEGRRKLLEEMIVTSINRRMPYDFYEFYAKLGYWDYLGDDFKPLREEARHWHVCHPSMIIKRLNSNSDKYPFICRNAYPQFIEGILTIEDKTGIPVYCHDIFPQGMSWLSGYGAALFVRVDKEEKWDKNYCTRIITSGTKPTRYSYVSKGTDFNSFNDWVFVDLLQAFTGGSLQHGHAVSNAIKLYKSIKSRYPDVELLFAGHSLGGGLASSCAVSVPECHAVTFNAAGLNFIGSMWTRITGAVANFSIETLRPLAIADRVHPIRIKGEIVDVLMIIAKGLTSCLNERAYGRYPLEISGVNKNTASKHGINNFLNRNILSLLHIPSKGTKKSSHSNITEVRVLSDNAASSASTFDLKLKFEILEGKAVTKINNKFMFKSTGALSVKNVKENIKIINEYLVNKE